MEVMQTDLPAGKESKRIFLSSPHMSREGYEKAYIEEAFASNWIAPLGNNVTEFENEMKEKLNAGKAVALSSGTAAIHMALKAAGVGEGDIVFCQSLTFSASANPIIYERAVPVFIDSDEMNWNMSPAALQKAFEKYGRLGKLPKAVIVVHLYGMCAKLEEIAAICKKYKTILIEDAAESLGSLYEDKYTGTYGDYGIISFNGNKIITTSGGGMLLINTEDAEEKAEKILFWSTQARDRAGWYQHTELGYNYRMSNVLAGIGRGQLRILDQRIEKKRQIYKLYQKHLEKWKEIQLMPADSMGKSNCWLTAATIKEGFRIRPGDIIHALERNNIECRRLWKPLHLQPVFKGCDFISGKEKIYPIDSITGADNSAAGKLFEQGLCLPSDTKMTETDLKRVSSIISKLWN